MVTGEKNSPDFQFLSALIGQIVIESRWETQRLHLSNSELRRSVDLLQQRIGELEQSLAEAKAYIEKEMAQNDANATRITSN